MSMRRPDVSINGVSLKSVDSRILVREISERQESESNFGNLAGRAGRLPIGLRLRRSKTIEVTFAIRELNDLTARAAVLDKVNGWAQDGVLTLTSRPGKRLRVYCTERAVGGDFRDYTAEYRVAFQTGGIPYWEDVSPVTQTITSGAAVTLPVPGTAPTVMDATITLREASSSVIITAGDSQFYLVNPTGFPAGYVIAFVHGPDGVLYGEDLTFRRRDSTDDLIVNPGQVSVSVIADGEFTAVVNVRGWWL